jgi:hypothetical protein
MTARSYTDIVAISAISAYLDTESVFDASFREGRLSPIDQFLINTNKINVFWAGEGITQEFGTICFLGYMSAVESYIRALIRGIIQVDSFAQEIAFDKDIKFGAAMHHEKSLLPEALMDSHSFISIKNIQTTFNDLIGLNLSLSNQVVKEFDKICQLRHCCVHRFGKLGAKNAMSLGMEKHKSLLEKPVNFNREQISLVSANLRSIVKTINNSAYKAVIDRTTPTFKNATDRRKYEREHTPVWAKNYSEDKAKFGLYYKLFATKNDTIITPRAKTMYDLMITERST